MLDNLNHRKEVPKAMRTRRHWVAVFMLLLGMPFFSAYLDARAVHSEVPFAAPQPLAELPDALQRLSEAGYRLAERKRVCGGIGDYYTLHKRGRWGLREIRIMAIFPIDQSFVSAAYTSTLVDAFSFDHT